MFIIDGVKVGSILEDVEDEADTPKPETAKAPSKPAQDKGTG